MDCFTEINAAFKFGDARIGLFNAFVILALIMLTVWVYKICMDVHKSGMCDNTFKAGYGYGARLEQIAEGGLGTTGESVYGAIGNTMPGRGGLGSDVYSEGGSVSPFFGAPEAPVFYTAGNEQLIANKQNQRLSGEAGTKIDNAALVGSWYKPVQNAAFYAKCSENPSSNECNLWKNMYCSDTNNSAKKVCGNPNQWVEGMSDADQRSSALLGM